jgi:hypothetical protein
MRVNAGYIVNNSRHCVAANCGSAERGSCSAVVAKAERRKPKNTSKFSGHMRDFADVSHMRRRRRSVKSAWRSSEDNDNEEARNSHDHMMSEYYRLDMDASRHRSTGASASTSC